MLLQQILQMDLTDPEELLHISGAKNAGEERGRERDGQNEMNIKRRVWVRADVLDETP